MCDVAAHCIENMFGPPCQMKKSMGTDLWRFAQAEAAWMNILLAAWDSEV
jgi:hypothetical protein